jgi:hypothetical protein
MVVQRVFIGDLVEVLRVGCGKGGIKEGSGVYRSEIVTGTARLDAKRP